MSRVNLGGSRWFSVAAARAWYEDRRWDGSNHISLATGSQWEHEALYRTAGGAWVHHCWSQGHGSGASYEVIAEERAHAWLIAQGHSGDVPAAVVAHAEA